MSFTVYFLKDQHNNLYIGQTNNLRRRIKEHLCNNQEAARFLKDNQGLYKLVYKEVFPSRIKAMQREKQLKGWTRAKKEALMNGNLDLLKRL